jgi:tRNA A37 threonylcarbamoyltransferase TsaD
MPAVSECIEKIDGKWEKIDAIALTVKPGLEVFTFCMSLFSRVYAKFFM